MTVLTEHRPDGAQTERMRTLVGLLAAALFALSGCGQQAGSDGTAGSGLRGTGKSADYRFTATTLGGETFEGSRLQGKPAVLWFWSPWCPTCRAQSPAVTRLAQDYDGDVAVIGVGGLDSAAAIRDLAAQIPHVMHLIDHRGAVWKHFRVRAQSTYTVIGADGEIMSEGYLDDHELAEMVERLAG